MRSRWTLALALCAALVMPAGAVASVPAATSKQDTAVAYFTSSDESQCLIMTLTQGLYRPVGGSTWSYGQALDVQLASDCAAYVNGSASLDTSAYRIFALTAAYVDTALEVGGHSVNVDLAWVAIGTPNLAVEDSDQHPDWSFVGKDVGAHLSGTVLVDGVAWLPDQASAILRTFSVAKNY